MYFTPKHLIIKIAKFYVHYVNLIPLGPTRQPALGRFLLPVAECTFALEQVLEDLQKDPWTCQPDERVQRCSGAALTVALVSANILRINRSHN